MKELRLLLIEDNEDDALLLERFLRRQGLAFTLRHVLDMPSFQAVFAQGGWDAIVCDFQFPGADALDLLPWVREADPDIPFIVVSGKVGEELAVAVMRAGANDFLVKGQLARLAPALEREVRDAEIRRKHHILEKERVKLHMAVHQMPDGLVITDVEGKIQYANPAMETISGYGLEELYGQTPRVFKSGQQDPAFYSNMWATLTSGRLWRGTFINRKKGGEFWHSEALICPVFGVDGKISNFVYTNRDVTAQRTMEARLQESQRLEALGLLTAGVAHDFNNLLMPILVHAEMGLRRTDLANREIEQFQSILKQVERAKNLTRQLVSYSRGGHESAEPIHLGPFMEETLALLRAAVPTEHALETHVEEPHLVILGAPTRLQQILLNLTSNALQAMQNRPGIIGLRLSRQVLPETFCVMDDLLPGGNYAVLEIKDTGCGIPIDLQDKIFLPFVTTKSKQQGTGLGLAIVLGLVREMGGGIQLESEVGQGTTFRILLPLMKGSAARTAQMLPAEVVLSGPALTLLMVDDDALLLSVASRALRELGHTVRSVRSPSKAMLWFRDHPNMPDAAVLDYAMPECSGLDLMAGLKGVRPDLPCVLVSGNLDQVDRERAEQLGCTELLQKPIQIKELIQALTRVLS